MTKPAPLNEGSRDQGVGSRTDGSEHAAPPPTAYPLLPTASTRVRVLASGGRVLIPYVVDKGGYIVRDDTVIANLDMSQAGPDLRAELHKAVDAAVDALEKMDAG